MRRNLGTVGHDGFGLPGGTRGEKETPLPEIPGGTSVVGSMEIEEELT